MNLETITKAFKALMVTKENEAEKTESKSQISESDVSIFSNKSEFSNYLAEKYDAAPKVLSKNLNDILKMDVVNGKIVEAEEAYDAALSDFDGEIEDVNPYERDNVQTSQPLSGSDKVAAELYEKLFGEEEKSKDLTLEGVINEILADKDVMEFIDVDGDGKLSEDEIKAFLSAASAIDSENGDLSLKDLLGAVDLIKNADKASLEDGLTEEDDEAAETAATEAETETPQAQGTSASAPSGGVSSGGASSGGSFGGVTSAATSAASSEPAEKTLQTMSLDELKSELNTAQTELGEKQDVLSKILDGSDSTIKDMEQDVEDNYEDYMKLLEEELPEIAEQVDEKHEEIQAKEDEIDSKTQEISDLNGKLSDAEASYDAAQNKVSGLESSLSSLKGALVGDISDEKKSEIEAKISACESELNAAKAEEEKAKNEVEETKTAIETAEDEKEKLEAELDKLNEEMAELEEKIDKEGSKELKELMNTYEESKTKLDEYKAEAVSKAQGEIDTAQKRVDEVQAAINDYEIKQKEKEFSASTFTFDFNETLTDSQKADLENFKKHFEENRERYEKAAEASGAPAELIAAIHWRESGGDFNGYLHNGDPIGTVTTHVPKGIYFATWEESAVDAMKNYGTKAENIDPNNIDTWYDYAEHYNGMGYRNRGLTSAYVWSGTDVYKGGKFVSDGKFDASVKDQQLGVAVMLKALLE